MNRPIDYRGTVENFGSKRYGCLEVEEEMDLLLERGYLRGLQGTTEPEENSSCFDPSIEPDERCRPILLIQPILVGIFTVLLIYCCWKKSMNDISDSYWCCCRKRRLKRQRQQGMNSMSASPVSSRQIRIADSTPDEQEQREHQQRQLREMASIRRRERQLHRIRLEMNARLEKMKGRIAEENNARRALLLVKFKKEGLEKTLTKENFVLNSEDTILSSKQSIESTITCEADRKDNRSNEDKASSNVIHNQLQLDQSEEGDFEKIPPEESMPCLCLRLNRSEGDSSKTRPSATKSSCSIFPNECAICLQEYLPNEVIVVSDNPSCVHCYHRDCIVEYLIPLLETEGFSTESDGDERNLTDERASRSSSSTTQSSDTSRGLPCPCCRLPFLVDPPRLLDKNLISVFSQTASSP